MILKEVVTQPTEEPVSIDEAKEHLPRVDIADEDAYIASLITGARFAAEQIARRAFVYAHAGFLVDWLALRKLYRNTATAGERGQCELCG